MSIARAIDMLRRASDEIKSLRRQIDHLAPKAEAYDALVALIGMFPRPPQGYGEDVVWRLEQAISELQADREATQTDQEVT